MPVIRKVLPKNIVKEEAVEPEAGSTGKRTSAATRRVCHFHKTSTEPAYWDASGLRKFLSDRGRIFPRSRTGTCAKHQRVLSREIKRARHLALLPYSVTI